MYTVTINFRDGKVTVLSAARTSAESGLYSVVLESDKIVILTYPIDLIESIHTELIE